jgi:hypothetical protein
MVWVWISSSSSILKQLENNGLIVKNERGGSLFYALTKNQIVRIISIASYLTKKIKKKNYLL